MLDVVSFFHQAAADTWYHGTRHVLKPGQVMQGGTHRSNQGYGQPGEHVYYSNQKDVASVFAEAGDGPDDDYNAHPRVYQVKPLEGHEPDPDEDEKFGSYRAKSVQVVKQVPYKYPTHPSARQAARDVSCHQCDGVGSWAYGGHDPDRKAERITCDKCAGTGTFKAADHWDAPDMPKEQTDAYTSPDDDSFGSHGRQQRRELNFAKNPVPGTKMWRGEVRHKDHVKDPPSVGMHWTTTPEMAIMNSNNELGDDQRHVLWEATVHDPAKQVVPRSHPIYQGRHMSMDSEAEIRLHPGTKVHVNRAFAWEGGDKGGGGRSNGFPYPSHSERAAAGWKAHTIERPVDVAHKSPRSDVVEDYAKFFKKSVTEHTCPEHPSKPSYFFHATHEGAMDKIQSEGLRPSTHSGKIWLAPSHEAGEHFAQSYDNPEQGLRGVLLRVRTQDVQPEHGGIPGSWSATGPIPRSQISVVQRSAHMATAGGADEPCGCCEGSGEHSTGRECLGCDGSGLEQFRDGSGPCEGTRPYGVDNEGHQVELHPLDGWQHLDGSLSHDDGTTVTDHDVRQDGGKIWRSPKTAVSFGDQDYSQKEYCKVHPWLPTHKIFGKAKTTFDPRLFVDEVMRPEFRDWIISRIGSVWYSRYHGWQRWARIYLAGSQATYWWGNRDIDTLIGIQHDWFRQDNPEFKDDSDEVIDVMLNQEFRETINSHDNVWLLLRSGTWHPKQPSPGTSSASSSSDTRTSDALPPSSLGSMTSASLRSVGTFGSPGSVETSSDETAGTPHEQREPALSVEQQSQYLSSKVSAGRVWPSTSASITSRPFSDSHRSGMTPSWSGKAEGVPSAGESGFSKIASITSTTTTPAATTSETTERPVESAFEESSVDGATKGSHTWERLTSSLPFAISPTRPPKPSGHEGYEVDGPWDSTFFVNADSWDIRKIKPYGAYEILSAKWYVRPPEVPADWGPKYWDESTWDHFEATLGLVNSIRKLPEPDRTRQGAALYEMLHGDRSRAFSADGYGWTDPGNTTFKALDLEPSHPLAFLIQCAHDAKEIPKTAGAKTRDDSVHRTPVTEFTKRFPPGEYDTRNGDADWDEVKNHPNFHEQNSFNPGRVHGGTWGDFVDDVAKHGIKEPVSVDHYDEKVSSGHHRVVAAIHTGQDVPWQWEHTYGCGCPEPGKTAGYAEYADEHHRPYNEGEAGGDRHRSREHHQPGDSWDHKGMGPKVGWVKTKSMMPYREYDRTKAGDYAQAGPDSRKIIDSIKDDLTSGNGWTDPIALFYHHKSHTALIGEGNHRLAAAHEAGIEHVPVRVIRSGDAVSERSHPAQWDRSQVRTQPNNHGYVPGDMHPNEIMPPEMLHPDSRHQEKTSAKTAGLAWYSTAKDDEIDSHESADYIRTQIGEHAAPGGQRYRLVRQNGREVSAHPMKSDGSAGATVGRLSWYGKTPDSTGVAHTIHEVKVHDSHQRRGLATGMLEFARQQSGEPVAHSHARTPDGKAWAEKTAAKGDPLTPLEMGDGVYYRLHNKDRPFSRADASTKNNGTSPHPGMDKYWEKKPGYSSFWNPHHLHQYLNEMDWDKGEKGSKIIKFRGTAVGEGADGESRVMPHTDKPEETMGVNKFRDRLEVTHGYSDRGQHTWGDGPNGQQVDDGYKTLGEITKGSAKADSVSVAGVCVKAEDTGRVLLLQRSMEDEKDPARGDWESGTSSTASRATFGVIDATTDQTTSRSVGFDLERLGSVEVTRAAHDLPGVGGRRRLPEQHVGSTSSLGQVSGGGAESVTTGGTTRTRGVEVVAGVVDDQARRKRPNAQHPDDLVDFFDRALEGGMPVSVRTLGGAPHIAPTVRGQDDLARYAKGESQQVSVAGICVKAEDTGRVLMLQRSLSDEDDPAKGKWEMPGGHLEDGEDPFTGGKREWSEETGHAFPSGHLAGNWLSGGIYQGFVYLIAAESDLDINLDHEDRHVLNPDDPDGDGIETVAWWEIDDLPKNPAVRQEVKDGTDWKLIEDATGSTDEGHKTDQKIAILYKIAEGEYRMEHQSPDPDYGAPLHDLTGMYGDDVYTHPHYFCGNPRAETVNAIHRTRGKPEADVTVYRAAPHGVADINQGDWVSTSASYARLHGSMRKSGDDWPVLKAKVKAKHLFNSGDLDEFGYHGPSVKNAPVHFAGGKSGREEYERTKPKTAASAHQGDGPFYHGTSADLAPGDALTPGDQQSAKAHGQHSDGTRVWVSNDPVRAGAYGHRLYEVTPHSTPRSPYAGHDEHYTTGATVVREVPWEEARSLSGRRQGSLSDEEYVLRMLAAEDDHDVSYHITDNPHFKPDPTKVPEDNTIAIHERTSPGLYTTKNPESWVNGHDYVRPYLAEIHSPKGMMHDQRWGGEGFIPAEHLDKVKVHRVIPLDEHVREEYHAPGWIEEHHGTTHDTGEPIVSSQWSKDDPPRTKFPQGYKYSGPDVRDMKPEQHRQHYNRWKGYMIGNRGMAYNQFDDKNMTTKSHADESDINDEGMFIHRDEHGQPTGKTSMRVTEPADEEYVLRMLEAV